MSNTYGTRFRFTIFGQSHAPAIGVTMEGLPVGLSIDEAKLQAFLDRRAPGRKRGTTTRREADKPVFIAGLAGGRTCGAPVTAVIYNTNTRSGDYENLRHVPRPGHADYPAMCRFGDSRDVAGGGQFSGRMTAPLCIAGGICLQLLERRGIAVTSEILAIGGKTDQAGMDAAVEAAMARGDSVGGVIGCCVTGLPVGLGEPMFGGMENRIAQAAFGIPAVKGIDFGSGFDAANLTGSEHNDPFYLENGVVKTKTNHHGGILGGMATGMPLTFRVAFKPTPSIAQPQRSVDLARQAEAELVIHGRHDPCIVLRAQPCVEAAAAVAVYDALLEGEAL